MDRRICSLCVREEYLRAEMELNGSDGLCSYCEQNGRTLPIGELADRVGAVVSNFFCLADLEAERGQPVVELIRHLAEVGDEVAEDVRDVLAVRSAGTEGDELVEGQFSPEARYVRKKIDAWGDYEGPWILFEMSLKTQTRYFNRDAARILSDVFDGIGGFIPKIDRPIVVKAGPGTEIPGLYRAREFQSKKEFIEAIKRPDRKMGPPPSQLAVAGRMNAVGISVFYGATDARVALAEVRPPVGSRVLVARFDIVKPLMLLDLDALEFIADPKGSVFDGTHVQRLKRAAFLRGLCGRISRPVMPHDKPRDYLPTQAVADFLANLANPPLDGIIYPSVQFGDAQSGVLYRASRRGVPTSDGRGRNVVLFHKTASIEPLYAADETDISVLPSNWCEELFDPLEDLNADPHFRDTGPEPAYSVVEKVIDETPKPESDAVLRFSDLKVHCVKAVKVDTVSSPVHRYRVNTNEGA